MQGLRKLSMDYLRKVLILEKVLISVQTREINTKRKGKTDLR
jgi:hypothetical protein